MDMARNSELELVARLRDGDGEAFDEAHRIHGPRLFNFLARLSRSRDVAGDLAEETWLRLVSHARQLRPDTELGAWLFTVGRNLYISYCRSRSIETEHASDLLGLWPSGTPHASPFEEASANQTERRIETALSSLPANYREVLLLVAVEGLQPHEAAAICGVTPEALRQRLHRARTMLAERLESSTQLAPARIREVLS